MSIADFEVQEPSPGFRVYSHQTRKFKAVTIALHVHQPLGERATSIALLPPVLRRGCRGYENMRKIVDFLDESFGASLGADVAKIGERQLILFRFDGVNDRFSPKKMKLLERALGFLWRLLSRPVGGKGGLHAPYVAQEKENLKRFIEGMINDRMAFATERCIQKMCKDEAYSRYEYGRLDEIAAVTPASLKGVHEEILATAPVDLFVVGDVSAHRVGEAAAAAFRWRRRTPQTPPPTEVRAGNGVLSEHVEKMDVEQGKLVMGCRTGVTWAGDEALPLSVYNGLLGAFPHSKLFANVREREGLAYATHSSLDLSKGLLFVTAGIDCSKYAKCLAVIREQMDDVAAGQFGDEEWEKTRRMIVDRVRSREDNPSSKIAAFAEMNLNGRCMTADEVIRGVEGVTRRDVMRAAGLVRPDTVFFLTRP